MPEITQSKYLVMAGWDDVPHLDQQTKQELYDSTPPYLRDARSKGIPSLGSGAIYPIPETEIVCDPFEIPHWWPRAYGMDVGWNRTAVIWAAIDREAQVAYLYSEHYRGQAEPSIHADAVRSRGAWMNGVIDPASRGRSQRDGEQLLQNYLDLGLNVSKAKNGVEAGIYKVYQLLSAGKLKVFRNCQNWLGEYRLYRRDEKGQIVKEHDHLMDATRYLAMSGFAVATPIPGDDFEEDFYDPDSRNSVTGY